MIRTFGFALVTVALGGCVSSPDITSSGGVPGVKLLTKKCVENRNPNHPNCSVSVTATLSGGRCTVTIDTDVMDLLKPSTDRRVGFILKSVGFNGTFDRSAPIKFFQVGTGTSKGVPVQNPPFKFPVDIDPSGNRFVLEPVASDGRSYAYSIHVIGSHANQQVRCESDPIIKNGS